MDFPSYPDEFRCPISLDIMTDPVILTSGHTFDRASIQRWLDSGNLNCPVTNLPLPGYPHLPLIPNHALRRLIQSTLPAPQQPRKSPPCPSIPSLSFPSDPQSLSSLLSSLKKFADLRREVAESDAPAVLIRHVASPHLPDLQKLAIYTLLYLSLDGDDVKVGLVAEGAIDALAAAIKPGGASAAAAATVITSLATVDVNKVSIGAHPTAIAGLAAMLGEGSSKKEKKEAATAIYELCKFPENRRRTVRAGAVRPLVGLADSGLDRAVEVLAQLAKLKEGREEMNKVESFIRILVGVLRGRAQRGIENSLSVLNWVCLEEEKARREALDEGVIEILAELVNEESGRIAKYAMGLLQTLQRGEM